MSWYTQILFKDSLKIRARQDISSDEYNDLIVLEKKIEQLYEAGILSEKEKKLVDAFKEGKNLTDLKGIVYKNKDTIAIVITSVFKKISFYLGGYFTDEGYVAYMTEKYNLSDEEVALMVEYMTSKLRYKLIRRKHKDESTG